MMSEEELNPENVSKGDIVQYEEKHRIACIVKIVGTIPTGSGFKRFEAEVLEPIFGSLGKEDTFKFGFNPDQKEMWKMYQVWKLKKPGAMTDYINGAIEVEKLQDYTDHLKDKYRDDD